MTRERSLWAWGWNDRFPDGARRAQLAQLASMLLGGGGFEQRALPRDDDALELPAPRTRPPSSLAAIASEAPRDRAAHTYGKGYPDLIRGFARDFAAAPDWIARPRDDGEVASVLDWCASSQTACIPYGGGTSVVGGVEHAHARAGRVTLDLGELSGVRELDATSRAARIGAGMKGPAIDDALADSGVTLRHFPQSYEHSTLGGWLATRAGGHFATVYTHIDDLCEAMTIVTPRGKVETRRLPASGAGPQPERLWLGSEGALGVITEAWMRVQPKPRWRASATVKFRAWDDAVAAARAIAQSGLHPTNCRLLDLTEALLHRVSMSGHHVLLLGFESADHPLGAWIARAVELAKEHRGELASGPAETDEQANDRATHRGEAGTWRQAFFDAPYLQSALVSIGVLADTFETACTWSAFPELHARVTRDVTAALKEVCGGGVVACRFTHVYPDGPAPYYTFLGRARIGGELEQWRAIKTAASDALIACGATITHHHAVGRVHRPWYERERPPLFADALRAVKRTLDPDGVMNPGVLLAESDQAR
ncbi:MAG TPA: FAD-binding oxidoreductase [Kofleriaceae bacterium]|nr:FAD-binding oxidoreductase [Kofleriaceae bacterium]